MLFVFPEQLAELADAFLLFLRQHPDVSRFHSDLTKGDRLQPGGITDEQLEPLLEKMKSDVRWVPMYQCPYTLQPLPTEAY